MLENDIYLNIEEIDPDAIIFLNWSVKAKLFPENRRTFGDLSRIPHNKVHKEQKQFKIFDIEGNEIEESNNLPNMVFEKEFKTQTINQIDKYEISDNINNTKNVYENKEYMEIANSTINQSVSERVENEFQKIDNYISNSTYINDIKEETLYEVSKNNVIINSLNESNNYTLEQVKNLEKTINSSVFNNVDNKFFLTTVEKKITEVTEANKEELKKEIGTVQKKFEDFVNS